MYRTDTVELSRPLLYDDVDDVFEREPYSVLIRSLLIGKPQKNRRGRPATSTQ